MADLGYDNRVAIVTGSGGGLGRQHALELARRGARVVVNDLGGALDGSPDDRGAAQRVVDEIEGAGGVAVADTNSVATPEGGAAIVQSAIDAFGQIDIVINNAGILRDKTFHKMTDDLLTPVLDVHLKGAFYVTQPAWVRMREQGYGRIVNTSSNSGLFGNFGQSNYGAAKMGLVGLTRVLAAEGARYNIGVNAIAPVAMTRMTEDLPAFAAVGEKLSPELVTPVVAWLAHEDCTATGEIYSAAGGVVARVFLGLCEGHFDPELTVEGVRDNFDKIRDPEGYTIPASPMDEFTKLFGYLG